MKEECKYILTYAMKKDVLKEHDIVKYLVPMPHALQPEFASSE